MRCENSPNGGRGGGGVMFGGGGDVGSWMAAKNEMERLREVSSQFHLAPNF